MICTRCKKRPAVVFITAMQGDEKKNEGLRNNFVQHTLYEVIRQVLKDVSLDIYKGEFVAILGHNGSGKSTLAKHFNAILTPSEGTIIVNGIDTKDEEKIFDIRQSVGMVFQNPDNQIVATIVEEDVAFALENLV